MKDDIRLAEALLPKLNLPLSAFFGQCCIHQTLCSAKSQFACNLTVEIAHSLCWHLPDLAPTISLSNT
jgi:hypothetical protein